MSKSLKNFITIREVLNSFTPTQIRMLFLLQSWDKKMNYQRVDTMMEVDKKILAFTEFFRKVCWWKS
jgi:cysteinyl-tRNA synthetase